MYRLLEVASSKGIGFQRFLTCCKQFAEDEGLMSLDFEEYDDVLPAQTMERFVRDFLQGLRSSVSDLELA